VIVKRGHRAPSSFCAPERGAFPIEAKRAIIQGMVTFSSTRTTHLRARLVASCGPARRAGVVLATCAMLFGCAASDPEPSKGNYTVEFPNTAAAVATDYVQILVFDVVDTSKRAELCDKLVSARITDPGTLRPSVSPPAPPANICEMHAGRKPITVPYGEHALLAIAQRKETKDNKEILTDFLIGCAIMTVGEGDAPIPIPLRVVSVSQVVPTTKCASVGAYCGNGCG
jgi:hypothetical protein